MPRFYEPVLFGPHQAREYEGEKGPLSESTLQLFDGVISSARRYENVTFAKHLKYTRHRDKVIDCANCTAVVESTQQMSAVNEHIQYDKSHYNKQPQC